MGESQVLACETGGGEVGVLMNGFRFGASMQEGAIISERDIENVNLGGGGLPPPVTGLGLSEGSTVDGVCFSLGRLLMLSSIVAIKLCP